MKLSDLVARSRSCRRFFEGEDVPPGVLRELVGLARLSPSGANRQSLKYFISSEKETNEKIFPNLSWAGYIKDWPGPPPGERPSAYIVILNDGNISKECGCDHGIAAQSIMLGASELGFSGCILGSVKREALREALDIEERFSIMLVLAIGKPREEIAIETVGDDGDIRYWRDEEGVHHVPKRALEELIVS